MRLAVFLFQNFCPGIFSGFRRPGKFRRQGDSAAFLGVA